MTNKDSRAEFISIGTELLLGDVINTNASWLSDQFKKNGIDVLYHTVVGDNVDRLFKVFEIANDRADLVVVTGGLGPTDDDLTREVFSEYSHLPLLQHEATWTKLKEYFAHKDEVMTKNNLKQTLVFEGALVFHNRVGIAPGMVLDFKGTRWVFLPGVPSEMKSLIQEDILPYLLDIDTSETIVSDVLKFAAIGESKLEELLRPVIDQQTNPTMALLATSSGLILRMTAKAKSVEEANQLLKIEKQQVIDLAQNFYIGTEKGTIFEHIVAQLRKKKQTIGAAESLTGGLFTSQMVEIPGCSDVLTGSIVCYDAKIKEKLVKVRNHTLHEYGTVSKECAEEMSKNITQIMDCTIGISFTGIAGPDAVEGKKVGTVWISIYHREYKEFTTQQFIFDGNRDSIRSQAMIKGYQLLQKALN